MELPFWIVLHDKPHLSCSTRHANEYKARVEAERLARNNPGERFLVARVDASVSVVAPLHWEGAPLQEGTDL